VKHWMFNCRKVSQKVSESLDRELPLHQRAMIKLHLMMCRHCFRFKKQLDLISLFCREDTTPPDDRDPPISLTTEACERIKSEIKKETAGRPGA
jgi:hypothetical protein